MTYTIGTLNPDMEGFCKFPGGTVSVLKNYYRVREVWLTTWLITAFRTVLRQVCVGLSFQRGMMLPQAYIKTAAGLADVHPATGHGNAVHNISHATNKLEPVFYQTTSWGGIAPGIEPVAHHGA